MWRLSALGAKRNIPEQNASAVGIELFTPIKKARRVCIMARHTALGRSQPAREAEPCGQAPTRHTEARGARGEVFCGRSALAVQPARMQSNRSQNAVNSRRSAYSSVLSVRLLSAGGANRRTEPGHKKGAWMQSYCNQFQWLVAVFASEVFFRNRNRWNVSGGYHVER